MSQLNDVALTEKQYEKLIRIQNEYKCLYKIVDNMLYDICYQMPDEIEIEIEEYIRPLREFNNKHCYNYKDGEIVF